MFSLYFQLHMTDQTESHKRPFLGMYFKCCRVYTRIYLNKAGTAFVGWCPKCAAKAEVKVAKGGSKGRFYYSE